MKQMLQTSLDGFAQRIRPRQAQLRRQLGPRELHYVRWSQLALSSTTFNEQLWSAQWLLPRQVALMNSVSLGDVLG